MHVCVRVRDAQEMRWQVSPRATGEKGRPPGPSLLQPSVGHAPLSSWCSAPGTAGTAWRSKGHRRAGWTRGLGVDSRFPLSRALGQVC